MAARSIPGAAPAAPISSPTASIGGAPSIGGSLNFGGLAAAGGMYSGGLEGLAASYSSAYAAALGLNQQNYNNILSGYDALAKSQYSNSQRIATGYADLTNDVLNRLSGANSANIQSINDQYTGQLGKAAQQLTSAGLNNTTIVNAVNRGIKIEQAKAYTQSNNDFAKLIASFQSNLGLAGLDYLNQANQQQTGLGLKQLDWMNSIDIAYPDPGAYTQLAMMYGQQAEADKNRELMEQYMRPVGGGSSGGGFSGTYGSGQIGGPAPYYGTGGYAGGSVQGTSPGALSKSATSYSGGFNSLGLPSTSYGDTGSNNALAGVVGGWAPMDPYAGYEGMEYEYLY